MTQDPTHTPHPTGQASPGPMVISLDWITPTRLSYMSAFSPNYTLGYLTLSLGLTLPTQQQQVNLPRLRWCVGPILSALGT